MEKCEICKRHRWCYLDITVCYPCWDNLNNLVKNYNHTSLLIFYDFDDQYKFILNRYGIKRRPYNGKNN